LVVILQLVLASFGELLSVPQFAVDVSIWLLGGVVVWIAHWDETSEDQWFDLDDVTPLFLELILDLLGKDILEVISVTLIDESVLEDSLALVSPKLEHVVLLEDSLS
jgi:hypothetical protein